MLRIPNSKFVLAGIGLTLTYAGAAIPADDFSIRISDDDIAVEASNASVQELLEELERLTGIPVEFVAETKERITLNVGLTNIENAISKITPNHMIVHEKQNGKQVIKELIILPDSGESDSANSGSAFLPNGQPAPTVEQPAQSLPLPTEQAVELPATPEVVPAPGDTPLPTAQDQTN